jgi:TonB family protein
MNHDDDDAGEDTLAPVNLHAWCVPPPPAQDRASILARALSPAAPPRRPRATWMVAALAIANLVLAAIIVIVVSHRPATTTVTVRPAGGGPIDPNIQQVLARLEQEQRELEQELADVQQLRRTVEQLSERVRHCEEADKRDRPGPKPRREPEPEQLVDPEHCDEVACVLTNYEAACCAPYKRGATTRTVPAASRLPDSLDRQRISTGIAAVRARVLACGRLPAAKGHVKVRVRVLPAGRVESVIVENTPEPALGACVAAAVQRATFEPTHRGGSFSYPFVFGASP